jgi:hypothetical protein
MWTLTKKVGDPFTDNPVGCRPIEGREVAMPQLSQKSQGRVMNLRFRLAQPVSIQNVRFPFGIRWHCHTGLYDISAEVALKRVTEVSGWYIPPETLFSVSVKPGIEGNASGTLALESPVTLTPLTPDLQSLHHAFWQGKAPFGRALAQQMFLHPAYEWSIAEVSKSVGVDTRLLRARLFREAYSFASTLRRCRLLRALLCALSEDESESEPVGNYMPRCQYRVDSMFNAAFKTKLSAITKSRFLSANRSVPPRCPAGIFWSSSSNRLATFD